MMAVAGNSRNGCSHGVGSDMGYIPSSILGLEHRLLEFSSSPRLRFRANSMTRLGAIFRLRQRGTDRHLIQATGIADLISVYYDASLFIIRIFYYYYCFIVLLLFYCYCYYFNNW